MMFPGEEEAIETVKRLADQYGYGNLIYHLRVAWSETLQAGGISKEAADMGGGLICVWCRTDTRTGRKMEAAALQPDAHGEVKG